MVNAEPIRTARRKGVAAPAAVLAAGLWLCLALAAGAAAQVGTASGTGPFFRIGTGAEGGSAFAVGEALAGRLQEALSAAAAADCEVPPCPESPRLAVAQLSNGGVANLRALAEGRLEAALVGAHVARWAAEGSGPFAEDGPLTDLRAIAALYPASLQVVTLARTGLGGIADLDGRRVSLDGLGSGTLPLALRVLAAYGLAPDDLELRHLEPTLAMERLAAGKLDAFFALDGVPLAPVGELAGMAAVRLLPVDAARLARGDLAEVVAPAVLPAGSYPGVGETATLAVPVLLLVRADLPEELAYLLTALLWAEGSGEALALAHPSGAAIALQRALDGLGAPLHPGAERHYRERGLLP